ncbi:MAG: hypothetical protein HC902_12870 [Calothrix sp. SM1_5_4]|nr:hypothetical protein [Calothrix sp. SM1_5_4]
MSILASLLMSSMVWAGRSEYQAYVCQVVSFTERMAVLSCDPSQPKTVLKTPRKWISSDQELRFQGTVRLQLSEAQRKEWMKLNGLKEDAE